VRYSTRRRTLDRTESNLPTKVIQTEQWRVL
jgi:hypothetical protein